MESIKRRLYTGTAALMLIALIMYDITAGSSAAAKMKDAVGDGVPDGVMRALYIPNHKSRDMKYMKELVSEGKPLGINMLVMDIHTFGSTKAKIDGSVIEYLKGEKFYLTARMVCFQDGIERLPVSDAKMKALYDLAGAAADAGFDEVQLDYIRFQDGGVPYPLKRKYSFIEEILGNFRRITDARKVRLSADLFGRIVYNSNDVIGQKVEIFAAHTDVLYPMLYPSHYTGDRQRMSAPGETVKEGTLKGLKRLSGKNVAIQPYIQAFPYNTQYAGVKLDEYVALQVKGVECTAARGWVAWNPNGDYSSVYSALRKIAADSAVRVAE